MAHRLAAVVVVVLFAGCGKKSPSPGPSTPAPSAPPAASQPERTPPPVETSKPAEPPKPDPAAVRAAEIKALLAQAGTGPVEGRVNAILKLQNCFPEAEPGLRATLSSGDPRVRLAAAQVLAKAGKGGADLLPAIREIIKADVALAAGAFTALRDAGVPASEFAVEIRASLENDDDTSKALRKALSASRDWCGRQLVAIYCDQPQTGPGTVLRSRVVSVLVAELPLPDSVLGAVEGQVVVDGQLNQKADPLLAELIHQSRGRPGRKALLARLAGMVSSTSHGNTRRSLMIKLAHGCRQDPECSDLLVPFLLDPADKQADEICNWLASRDASGETCAVVAGHIAPTSDPVILRRSIQFFLRDGSSAVDALVAFLQTGDPATLRQERALASQALASSGPKGAAASLAALAKETRLAVRADLIAGAASADPGDDAVLRAILPDLEVQATRGAVLGVYAAAGPRAAFAIRRLLELLPTDPGVLAAISSIGVKRKEDADLLLAWSKTHPNELRTVALSLRPFPEAARPLYEQQMKSPAWNVAAEALDYFGECGTPKDVEILRSVLKSKRGDLHCRAIVALGRVGPGAAASVPDLVAFASESQRQCAPAALRSLGRIGPAARSAEEAIRKLAGSNDRNLAYQARIVLFALGLEARPSADEWKVMVVQGWTESMAEFLWDVPAPDAGLASVLKGRLVNKDLGEVYLQLYLRHERLPDGIQTALGAYPPREGWGRDVASEARILAGVDVENALSCIKPPQATQDQGWSEMDLRLADALLPLARKDWRAFALLRLLAGRTESPVGCHASFLMQKMRKE